MKLNSFVLVFNYYSLARPLRGGCAKLDLAYLAVNDELAVNGLDSTVEDSVS